MKRNYLVGVREVHVRHFSVKAENEEEAKELVYDRDKSAVDIDFFEYSHEMNRDTWSVEEVPEKKKQPRRKKEDEEP